MVKYIMSFFIFFVSSAYAQEKVNVYSRFPPSEVPSLVLMQLIKEANSIQSEYEFKLNVLPGAGGEVADKKALVVSKMGEKVVVFGTITNFTLNRIIYGNNFDRENDFIQVLAASNIPVSIMVNPNSNIYSLKDLVEHIKNKPKIYNASTTQAVASRLLDSVFKERYNINNISLLEYKMASERIKSLLIGETDYTIANPIDSTGLRQLVISSEERHHFFPEIPTGKEVGFPEFVYTGYQLIYVPNIDKKFTENVRSFFYTSCKSKNVMEFMISVKYTAVCNNDTNWIKEQISKQNILIEKHKESIK